LWPSYDETISIKSSDNFSKICKAVGTECEDKLLIVVIYGYCQRMYPMLFCYFDFRFGGFYFDFGLVPLWGCVQVT